MLRDKILKESFVAVKVGNSANAVNIMVYLLPGRFKDKLSREKLEISDGISDISKVEFQDEKIHRKENAKRVE